MPEMRDFAQMIKEDRSFVPRTSTELDEYLEWAHAQVCQCGKKASERPKTGEMWATETICWECFVGKGPHA